MSPPPKYPRIPHLAASPAAPADDAVLTPQERASLLAADVVVEEKLDGMNVVIWIDDGIPRVGTRGGEDTSDRSGERGRLRAWALTHADALTVALGDRFAVYSEWLRRRHVVAYDRLPGELVGFDVLDRTSGRFLAVRVRDDVLRDAEVAVPPRTFTGALGSVDALDALLGGVRRHPSRRPRGAGRVATGDAYRQARRPDLARHRPRSLALREHACEREQPSPAGVSHRRLDVVASELPGAPRLLLQRATEEPNR